jgi:hypothetical protein
MAKTDFEIIRQRIAESSYEISVHASKRLRQRQISLVELEQVIISGEIIESDPRAKPYPKCIFLGYIEPKGEALHVVCSLTPQAMIVTVYFPGEDRWAQDRIRRR